MSDTIHGKSTVGESSSSKLPSGSLPTGSGTDAPTGRPIDPHAAEEFVRSNIDSVYSLMLRMLGHKEDAEDRTQEVFHRALRALPGYRGDARPSTWVYRIAINVGRDAIQQRQKLRKLGGAEVNPDRHASGSNPEMILIDSEEKRMLLDALNLISDDKKELILMADMEGLAHAEIAEAVGIPAGTVKSRLHRARAALRQEVRRMTETKS